MEFLKQVFTYKNLFQNPLVSGWIEKKKKKSLVAGQGFTQHFSFLFVIPVIFVSYALAKKGDLYLLELGFNKHYALWWTREWFIDNLSLIFMKLQTPELQSW